MEIRPGQKARAYIREPSPPVWQFKMMNDEDRNRPLRDAIFRKVRPGSRVIEVGTGGGLLAMYAARAGAAYVCSLEADPIVAQAATEIIKRNGLENRITVLPIHSRDFAGTSIASEARASEANKFD